MYFTLHELITLFPLLFLPVEFKKIFRRHGVVNIIATFQLCGPFSIPSGVRNFNFCLRTGCCPWCSLLCCLWRWPWYSADHSFQGGPPLCIYVVFWSKVCYSLYRHIIHGYLEYKSRGCNYYRASQILRAATDGCRSRTWFACRSASGASYWRCSQTLTLLLQFSFLVDCHAHRRKFPNRRR